MASHDYEFLSRWRVPARVEEVSAILGDPLALPEYWPAVYLQADEIEAGEPRTGVGRVIALLTKGYLPYTLRWSFRVADNREPHGFTIDAWGDFDGRGVWTFTADGPFVDIRFDWRVRANKPILRWLSFIMKPLFGWNHAWAMARGEESLRLELARRRADGPEERARVPPPPGAPRGWASRQRADGV